MLNMLMSQHANKVAGKEQDKDAKGAVLLDKQSKAGMSFAFYIILSLY